MFYKSCVNLSFVFRDGVLMRQDILKYLVKLLGEFQMFTNLTQYEFPIFQKFSTKFTVYIRQKSLQMIVKRHILLIEIEENFFH